MASFDDRFGDITAGNLGGRVPPDWFSGAVYEPSEQSPFPDPTQARLATLGDAFDRAALMTRRSASGNREEGPATRFVEENFGLPKTPLEAGMKVAFGPFGGVGAKIGALALGGLLQSTQAEAGPGGKLLRLGAGAPKGGGVFPGIFQHPNDLAAQAEAMVAPEHPALKQLFNVNRDDLYQIGQQGRRQGNITDPQYGGKAANPGGSYIIQGVGTPENEQRILDALGVAGVRAPGLTKGMDAWYVMDPAFQQMEKIMGREAALREYPKLNTSISVMSAMSPVETEINRGTAAYMMQHQGQWPDFVKYGGLKATKRGEDFPAMLRDVKGVTAHSTAQSPALTRFYETGELGMQSPKVPLYVQASGVPQTGFQTRLPVADAHFTRAIGAADVRAAHGHADPGVSLKSPEYNQVGPWFRDRIAAPLGIEAVPAQGRLWGLMAPQTGVDTLIGAPKLELLAKRIWERAMQKGIDPKVMRDYVLRGAAHASLGPESLGGPDMGVG